MRQGEMLQENLLYLLFGRDRAKLNLQSGFISIFLADKAKSSSQFGFIPGLGTYFLIRSTVYSFISSLRQIFVPISCLSFAPWNSGGKDGTFSESIKEKFADDSSREERIGKAAL
jgi:hypothetical protein